MNIYSEEWEAVIGLEIHVQLSTKSKLFSGASTDFGALPNTQACNIDLAMPGVLPVLNEEVLRMAIKLGKALNAEINSPTSFARKNYFYPDSPKGYQISQMDKPIVEDGYLDIETDKGAKRIGVTRAHLEEDAGKSLHDDFEGQSGIDLNRAGTPLLEIVSEPEISTPEEAVAYLKSIHSIIRYLEISDGNMAEGSMRCDANVSVRKKGDETLGTRTETKNVNSFRFVEKAIQYEIERQINELESAEKKNYMEMIGLKETGLSMLIQKGYKILELDTYFTSGPEETRAWTIQKNCTAPKAAGEIHTDFEKGFIRAETVSYEEFVANEGWVNSKTNGKMRLEGKDYIVKDGDVLNFRFNT